MAPITNPTRRGRLIKFTPERIEQIKNLVERGKSREEIAELLDVTVGSLQVTCSRLGISLRRVTLKSHPPARYGNKRKCGHVSQVQTTTQPRTQSKVPDAIMANFSIKIQYNGEERTTEFPLTTSMIRRLALEAEFRDMRICDLISELLMAAMKNDLPRPLLDPQKAAA
jgi:hypothetical protein